MSSRNKVKCSSAKNKSDILVNTSFEFTENQQKIIETMLNYNTRAVFVSGPAGTGKTHMAVYAGLSLIAKKKAKKLIYIRSIVESSHQKLGFLPGSSQDKTEPYFEVLYSKLDDMLSEEEISRIKTDNLVDAVPINFLRGRDFKDSVIIVDEFQNVDFDEATTIITRLNEGSRIFFAFDPIQSDLKGKAKKDATTFANLFDNDKAKEHGVYHFQLTSDEIKRSEFCKFVVQTIEKYKENTKE